MIFSWFIFSGGLSKTNSDDFESVQKSAFKVILRGEYHDYDNALDFLEQTTLKERRKEISLKFAKKNVNHPKMKHLFRRKKNLETRKGGKFIEPRYRTDRANNGPVNYLIRLLNGDQWKFCHWYYVSYYSIIVMFILWPVDDEVVAE